MEDDAIPVRPKSYDKPQSVFEWQGPRRPHVEKDHQFFMYLSVGAVLVAFVFIVFSQFILAFLVFALAFAIYAVNRTEPKQISFQLMTTGIKVKEEEYRYEDMDSFWIEQYGDAQVFKIRSYKAPFRLEIMVPQEQEEGMEKQLLKHIPYIEDKSNRIMKFIERLLLPTHR